MDGKVAGKKVSEKNLLSYVEGPCQCKVLIRCIDQIMESQAPLNEDWQVNVLDNTMTPTT